MEIIINGVKVHYKGSRLSNDDVAYISACIAERFDRPIVLFDIDNQHYMKFASKAQVTECINQQCGLCSISMGNFKSGVVYCMCGISSKDITEDDIALAKSLWLKDISVKRSGDVLWVEE